MKLQVAFMCVCLLTTIVDAKTVFRRTDKIADNFKRIELPPEEFDPNVAPPEPQRIETIDPESIDSSSVVDSIIEDTPTAIPIEVIDVDFNSIDEDVEAVTVLSSIQSTSVAPVIETTTLKNTVEENGLNRYCKCADAYCDCCREFRLPLLPIVRGPGCARVSFLGNDKMSVSLKYGDLTLASRTISGKRAKPICVGLPGGYSQFCGRVYGLSRSQDNFKACLGFELRADDEVEAALRVSCFKFGPSGLRVADSEPLPSEVKDEDDDDDIFGFGAETDDEDEDEEDDDSAEEEENDDTDAPVDPDYEGFSLGTLLEELDDEDDDEPTKTEIVAQNDTISTAPVPAQTRVLVKEDNTVGVSTNMQSSALSNNTLNTVVNKSTNTDIKKNKTKKAKSADESDADYTYDILQGLLEIFN